MRTDTKLAIVVAVVCIVLGAWYITSGPQSTSTPTAQETPETAPPADTVADSKPDAPATPPRIVRKQEPKPSEPVTADRPPSPAPQGRSAAPATDSAQAEAPGLEQSPESVVSLPPIELPAGPPIEPVPLPRAGGVGLADEPALPASSDPEPAAAGTAQPSVTETASDAAARTVAQAPQAPEPSKPAFTEHTIQSGDTYSSLAVRYLGHARHANRIAEANPTLEARRLRVGAVVKIPASDEQRAATAGASPREAAPSGTATASPAPAATTPQAGPIPTERSYEVKPGEGWYTLAERFLGNGTRWTELYELNKGRVPPNFNILPAGTTIELPPGVQITQ
jgi:nucleoid-associated protein YgaU